MLKTTAHNLALGAAAVATILGVTAGVAHLDDKLGGGGGSSW